MDLQILSGVQTGMEHLFEKIYDATEATLDKVKNKESVELGYVNAASDLILLLEKSIPENRKQATSKIRKVRYINKLLASICQCADISEIELANSHALRKRKFVLPRQVHMAFLHKTFGYSQASAGDVYFKDHATTLASAKTVKNLFNTNRVFREEYKNVIDICKRYDKTCGNTNTNDYLTGKGKKK